MSLTGAMTVSDLVRLHPWAEEILDAYGLTGLEQDPMLTLDGLCWLNRIDRDALLTELDAARTWRDAALVPPPGELFESLPYVG